MVSYLMGYKALRSEIRGVLTLALLLGSPGCEASAPEIENSRLPAVPECDFGFQHIAPDDPVGPYTPRLLSTQLTGDYRILITWATGQQEEVPFSLTVSPDGTTMKEPLNAECYKPLLYLTSYEFVEQGSVTSDEFVLAPIRDNFLRMKHHFRVALVPESAFPPEATSSEFLGEGWTLDYVELGVRWHPSAEGTVADGRLLAYYALPDGKQRVTSALLGLVAIFPESSFHPPQKEPSDDLKDD